MKATDKIFRIFLCYIFICVCTNLNAQPQSSNRSILFDKAWTFKLDTVSAGPENPGFDDSDWRILDLPHDWSAEDIATQMPDSIVGPFYRNSPSATFDGFTYGGTGWYRKSFELSTAEKGKHIFI